MEHRHIPASRDGSIPSAKTRFWRGEDNFLEEKWYGRCAICGELICPPKPWYFIRSDIYDDYLGPLTHPIDGYHETWIVNVDVYIDTGEERYLERREYVYMLARNSPTGAFWYQCSASYSRVYGDG